MHKDDLVYVGHKVVHDYLHVDYDIVWAVATVDLPPLVAELERIMSSNVKDPDLFERE